MEAEQAARDAAVAERKARMDAAFRRGGGDALCATLEERARADEARAERQATERAAAQQAAAQKAQAQRSAAAREQAAALASQVRERREAISRKVHSAAAEGGGFVQDLCSLNVCTSDAHPGPGSCPTHVSASMSQCLCRWSANAWMGRRRGGRKRRTRRARARTLQRSRRSRLPPSARARRRRPRSARGSAPTSWRCRSGGAVSVRAACPRPPAVCY